MTGAAPHSPNPDAEFAAALRLHAQGDLLSAAAVYERLLHAAPESPRVASQLGVLRMQQKRLDEAMQLFDRAILLDAAAPEPYAWRGEVLRQQGDTQAAVEAFHAALARAPTMPPALFNLGLAQADLGDSIAARNAWLKFLVQRPRDPRIRRELGRLAFDRRDYPEAADWFSKQIAAFPADTEATCDLATVLLAQHAYVRARQLLTPAMLRLGEHARAERLVAQALIGEGRPADALDVLTKVIVRDSRDADAAYQAGRACDAMARLDEAIRWFVTAAELSPENADVRNALAVAQLNLGNHAEAVASFRAAIQLRPAFHEAHSNLLMAMHYIEGIDARSMFDEHSRWAAQHGYPDPHPRDSFVNARETERRLRIGYVSPRFCFGPLMHFFLPLLEAHDRHTFDVTCYAVSDIRDGATDMMRGHVDRWVDCAELSDDALAALIRKDRIDILIDLAGHCPGNRLGVFSRRAAPVQVSWMDYDDTTGLSTMDYLLTDAGHTPIGGEQLFVEKVVRLPDTRLCYRPIDSLPMVERLPSLQRGHVTFGCFNRLSKIGGSVVRTWSEVLLRVPRSRLILKSTSFASESTRSIVTARFAAYGVAADRLDLRPFSDELVMMCEYGEVDIALDPFPYNGYTTTCDALAMGVPVVTLQGHTLAARHGAALLGSCGLQDWVAHTTDEYIAIACTAASDINELNYLRLQRRAMFLRSPACDGVRFARSVEAAYGAMWTRWCIDSGQAPGLDRSSAP